MRPDSHPQQHVYGAHLSLGQRRRLSMAMALAPRPTVLALDEPMNGLDAPNADIVTGLVAQHLRAGGAVVLVSHAELPGLADRVLCLEAGRLVPEVPDACSVATGPGGPR